VNKSISLLSILKEENIVTNKSSRLAFHAYGVAIRKQTVCTRWLDIWLASAENKAIHSFCQIDPESTAANPLLLRAATPRKSWLISLRWWIHTFIKQLQPGSRLYLYLHMILFNPEAEQRLRSETENYLHTADQKGSEGSSRRLFTHLFAKIWILLWKSTDFHRRFRRATGSK